MMKMNFSRNTGISGVVIPFFLLVFVFLFSGVSLSAQHSDRANVELQKSYGVNFMDANEASILAKESHAVMLNYKPTSVVQEVEKALDLIYTDVLMHKLGEGLSVVDALTVSYATISTKKLDYNVTVDIAAIHEKYYSLLTL